MTAVDEGERLEAEDVVWDLSDLVRERTFEELLDDADRLAEELATERGKVASYDREALLSFMARQATLSDTLGKAGSWASLQFAADVTDPVNGARMQHYQERATAVSTKLIWFDLEWVALDDARAAELVDDERLHFARHYLEDLRKLRPHLLTEAEERILTEKAVTGRGAWSRLFSELTSTIKVDLDGREATLEEGLSRIQSPDPEVRSSAAASVTAALAPGLRTRAFIYNTLLADKATDDRLRSYPTWITSRNMSNEASDESVQALVDAVKRRYDVPQRWYALKARGLG